MIIVVLDVKRQLLAVIPLPPQPAALRASAGETVAMEVVFGAVLVGSAVQRLTGLGFALVTTPVFVMALGPWDGVLLAMVGGLFTCAFTTARYWRRMDWARVVPIGGWAALAIPPGLWIATVAPVRLLEALIGVSACLGLTMVKGANRMRMPSLTGLPLVSSTGFTSGFFASMAGLGGPPMVIYAVLSRWDAKEFAISIQPLFLFLASTTLLARWGISGRLLPALTTQEWVFCGLAGVVGFAVGTALARILSAKLIATGMFWLAFAGGSIMIGRAFLS
jgi:uncharacterized protein